MSNYGLPYEQEAEEMIIYSLMNDESTFELLKENDINSDMFAGNVTKSLWNIYSNFVETNGRKPITAEIQRYIKHHNDGITENDLSNIIDKPYKLLSKGEITILSHRLKESCARRKTEKAIATLSEKIKDPNCTYTDAIAYFQGFASKEIQLLQPAKDPKEELNAFMKLHTVTAADEFKEDPLLVFNGKGFIPRGDVNLVKGQQKNGKSLWVSILIASVLGCRKFGFSCPVKDPSVVLFDTEQRKFNASNIARRINRLLGLDERFIDSRFHIESMRGEDVDQCKKVIHDYIIYNRPTLAVIDGVVDLVNNFNDEKETKQLVTAHMALTQQTNCTIISVLHTNKTATSQSRGHLGSFEEQKSADIFEVKKNPVTEKKSDISFQCICSFKKWR